MHPLHNGSQVVARPPKKPTSGTRGYFTESGENNVPSYPGQDWFNDNIDEFMNALDAAGIVFDENSTQHLSQLFSLSLPSSLGNDVVVFPTTKPSLEVGDTLTLDITHVKIQGEVFELSSSILGEVSAIVLDSYSNPVSITVGSTTLFLITRPFYNAKKKNTENFGRLFDKIQKDDGSETIVINCRGDSLTYGEDTTVDPQPADSSPTPSGRSHTMTRASESYPVALGRFLRDVFENTIIVHNQGFSGDNTKSGWNDWNQDLNQDLTVIMYGTNDAAFGFSPYQDFDAFLFYYRKIIEREIFVFNSAVMLIAPPPQKQVNSNTRLLDAYRAAIFALANEYGCPVVDGAEVFRSADSTLFSDNVHFRTLGYQWLAASIYSRILSKPNRFSSVASGSNMSVRFPEEGIKANWSNWGIQTQKASQVTPPLTSFTGGYVVETSSYDEVVSFNFYCECDDLIAIPNIEVANAKVVVSLNQGLWQPQYTFDDRVVEIVGGDLTAKPASVYEVDALNETLVLNRNSISELALQNRMHIASRGWKTLSFKILSNGSSGSPRLTVGGVNFESYEVINLWDSIRYAVKAPSTPIGNYTPLYIGQEYLDTSVGVFTWYKSTGLSNTDWKILTSGPNDTTQSGNQNPIGNVTPRFLGDEYLDTSPGQYIWYKSTGLSNTDWKIIT
ncbi:SGNH/GDSL hydrolase family protein [Vibrio alginolyticus]